MNIHRSGVTETHPPLLMMPSNPKLADVIMGGAEEVEDMGLVLKVRVKSIPFRLTGGRATVVAGEKVAAGVGNG